MEIVQPEGDVGVIVGRFQVPYLHEAHLDLFKTVKARHKRVAAFLGVSPVMTRVNPMPFEPRSQMIQEQFPDVVVLPIADVKYDDAWVDSLERQIDLLFPTNTVVLYGSRESFVACYKRVYEERSKKPRRAVVELKSEVNISGTKLRTEAANSVIANEAFRTGMIFAMSNVFKKVCPTVDFAITRDKRELLLAKRGKELKYRFPGGFADPTDKSYEMAVRRERLEETQVEAGEERYLGSALVDDWRYRGSGDSIMTALYETEWKFGPAIASDDVDEVRWFAWVDLRFDLVEPEHEPLMKMFLDAHAIEIANLRAGRTA